VLPVRGNIDTRLRKLDSGAFDALILAACGLKRLGYDRKIADYFDPETFIPAAGQGVLCCQTRADHAGLNRALKRLSCSESENAAQAERNVLAALGAGCRVPFGVYARFGAGKFLIVARGYDDGKCIEGRKNCSGRDWEKATNELIQHICPQIKG
jgi:hydroxymethylbilane synthase